MVVTTGTDRIAAAPWGICLGRCPLADDDLVRAARSLDAACRFAAVILARRGVRLVLGNHVHRGGIRGDHVHHQTEGIADTAATDSDADEGCLTGCVMASLQNRQKKKLVIWLPTLPRYSPFYAQICKTAKECAFDLKRYAVD